MRRIYRWYRTIKLFLGIVWRFDWSEQRMSINTAWFIARIVHPRADDFREDIYRRKGN